MNQSRQQRAGWWLFAAAIVVTVAAYASGLSGGWLFDDFPNIVNNPGIQIQHATLPDLTRAALSSPSSTFKRPLASLTFAFNYLGSGLDPFWWKVTNVVIHLINGLLVFVLARLLLRLGLPYIHREHGAAGVDARHIGIVAALIAGGWMLLPINLTAVLYVVQRMTSMANAFVLLGLIGYVVGRMRMRDGNHARGRAFGLCIASLIVCTAIGFTAKETAVMLPLYAFLIEWVLFRFGARAPSSDFDSTTIPTKGKRDPWVIGLFIVMLVLPMLAGLAWLLPSTFSPETWATRDFTLGTRLLSEARIVCDYIVWTLLPTPNPLSFYHDGYVISSGLLTPWTTLASIIVIAALLALAIWLRKRAPLASLGLLLFFGAQTLTATILPLELIYEHRNYFASFGLLLALMPLLAAVPGKLAGTGSDTVQGFPLALPRYVLLVGLLLLWTAQTALTAYAWGNPLRLAQTLAARAPDSPRAQYQLGRSYIIHSHYDPDSPFTEAAYAPLERAAAMPKSSILPQQALIFMNSRMHRPIKDKWWDSMIAKLKAHDPGVQDVSSLAALTKCAREGGCELSEEHMVAAFLAALDHPDPSARLLATYGDYAWNVLGDQSLGARMLTQAVKTSPEEPAYHITLTRMLAAQGRTDDARAQINALQKLNIGGRLNGSIAGLRVLLAESSSK
ncbi:MAG TPA: hypothetical protein VFJ15_04140 [Oleiagrimonas sp.]|nr:hypothetical protein [Oleiagrimonas sp.]